MTQTLLTTFSDAEIRRRAAEREIRDLRDARHRGVYFRYSKERDRGTWYLVKGKAWMKIARWPDLPTKSLIIALPSIHERLAIDPKASATAGTLHTVGALLDWYLNRQSRDRSLSSKRRSTTT